MLDPDTSASAGSHAAALRAAGGVLAAVEAVLAGGYAGAFAAVRPPGHHAEADRAMGFCLFNNAAVAARWALERRGLRRVLLVDWDVHHGNGTMHSFYDSREVLYFSVHQYPHYPGTGRVEELGQGRGAGLHGERSAAREARATPSTWPCSGSSCARWRWPTGPS